MLGPLVVRHSHCCHVAVMSGLDVASMSGLYVTVMPWPSISVCMSSAFYVAAMLIFMPLPCRAFMPLPCLAFVLQIASTSASMLPNAIDLGHGEQLVNGSLISAGGLDDWYGTAMAKQELIRAELAVVFSETPFSARGAGSPVADPAPKSPSVLGERATAFKRIFSLLRISFAEIRSLSSSATDHIVAYHGVPAADPKDFAARLYQSLARESSELFAQ